MNWASFFTTNTEISTDRTREYISTRPPGSFQLVDVRQPKEYEQDHIPGAILMPLGELVTRLHEIDREQETIVYCRTGARSSAACQILEESDFPRVLNMSGGILSWHGQRAGGGETLGLEYFVNADFPSAFAMAYQMEDGLQEFYLRMAATAEQRENQNLLEFMAQLEDGHKAKLRAQHPGMTPLADSETDAIVVEGGLDPTDFSVRFAGRLDTIEAILQIAMMFEAQAYDLYSRLARRHDSEARSFFLQMAGEELKHLARLGRELDNRLA
jgi:sulfur-carrier protein adenylyltransferase/sulfurtransferase